MVWYVRMRKDTPQCFYLCEWHKQITLGVYLEQWCFAFEFYFIIFLSVHSPSWNASDHLITVPFSPLTLMSFQTFYVFLLIHRMRRFTQHPAIVHVMLCYVVRYGDFYCRASKTEEKWLLMGCIYIKRCSNGRWQTSITTLHSFGSKPSIQFLQLQN